MKKTISIFLLLCGLLFSFFLTAQEQKIDTKQIWATPDILTTSESVFYDSGNDLLLVSCINGNPTDKDGNGFIAQVSLNGDIIMQKWATGLNAPKGMAVVGDKLYVTDIDRVVQIDMKSGAVMREFPVEGAKFLNDMIPDKEGNIYISDMGTGKIHRLHNGAIGVWIDDDKIVSPNGMNIKDNEILIGTKNGLFGVRIDDKRIWQIVKLEGGIDGLKLFGNNGYIVSDWVGHVRIISPDSEPQLLFDLSKKKMNAADIEYIPQKNMLLVPTFSDNRVVAFEISE